MKVRIKLRSVQTEPLRPWAEPTEDLRTQDEKRADAIAYLKQRNIYVLQQGSKTPAWGMPQPGAKK